MMSRTTTALHYWILIGLPPPLDDADYCTDDQAGRGEGGFWGRCGPGEGDGRTADD